MPCPYGNIFVVFSGSQAEPGNAIREALPRYQLVINLSVALTQITPPNPQFKQG